MILICVTLFWHSWASYNLELYTVPAPDISLKLDVDLSPYDDEENEYDIPLVHRRLFQIDIHDHSQDTGSCVSSLVFEGVDDFNGNLYSDSDNETIVYDLESKIQPSQGDVITDKSMCDKLDVDKTEDQLLDLDNSEKDLSVKHTADTEVQVALDNVEPGEIPNNNEDQGGLNTDNSDDKLLIDNIEPGEIPHNSEDQGGLNTDNSDDKLPIDNVEPGEIPNNSEDQGGLNNTDNSEDEDGKSPDKIFPSPNVNLS